MQRPHHCARLSLALAVSRSVVSAGLAFPIGTGNTMIGLSTKMIYHQYLIIRLFVVYARTGGIGILVQGGLGQVSLPVARLIRLVCVSQTATSEEKRQLR